jgi:class 3 adenylate cyclase
MVVMTQKITDMLDDRLLGLRLTARPEPAAGSRGQQRTQCPTCGAMAAGSHRFCPRCGRALAAALRTSAEGTVTVAFTDVEDSCGIQQRYSGTEVQELMALHNRIVRRQVDGSGGFEVKFLGDGVMLAFSSARAALRCSVGVQLAFAEHTG